MQMGYTTLQLRCKEDQGISLQHYIKEMGADGRMSIRRWQMAKAKEGNPTMLIWLGKQYLGQKDKREDDHTHTILEMSYPRPNAPKKG